MQQDHDLAPRNARVRFWERLARAGERAQGRGETESAEKYFRAALTHAEEIADVFYFGYTLGRLGMLYEAQGQLDAAERCYQRAIAVETFAYDAKDVHRVPNLGRMVCLLSRLGRDGEAREMLVEVNRVRDAVLLESPSVDALDRVREAYSLGILANFYQESGDLDQAEELYWLELTELEATLKAESPYLARPLRRLAKVLRATGRETEALRLEERARAIASPPQGATPATTKEQRETTAH